MEFYVNIADKIIKITSLHDRIFHMCRNYLVETQELSVPVDLEVSISEADIQFERGRINKEEKQIRDFYSEAYLETLAIYRKIANGLLEKDTFLMHGSVVGYGDRAVMFTATSGMGKTTLTRYLLTKNEELFVINGDKPLISTRAGEKPYVFGTPWCGKENLNTNCKKELSSIIILERTDKLFLQKVEFRQVFNILLQQTYRPTDSMGMKMTLELLNRTSRNVSFYRFALPYYEKATGILEDARVEEMLSSVFL